MTPAQIHERLKAAFGAAIGDLAAPAAGDPHVRIEPARVLDVCRFVQAEKDLRFNSLVCVSGLDLKDRLASVYHLHSLVHKHWLVLRCELPRDNPRVPSVCPVWKAANWLERETYDMFGIVYEGHPDLRRILCPDDWEGWPLRKDYKVQETWHGLRVPYVDRAGFADGTFVFGGETPYGPPALQGKTGKPPAPAAKPPVAGPPAARPPAAVK